MTDVPLQVYLEHQITELDKRIDQRIKDLEQRLGQHFDLNDKAINKAEIANNERLGKMNEMRGAMEDLSKNMASRESLETLADIVAELRREKANLDGRLIVMSVLGSVVVNWVLVHYVGK